MGACRRLILGLGLALGACTASDVERYRAERPQFDLERFFVGTTDAWGLFQKRGGTVARRFHVVIEGRREAGTLVLDERFEYSDGERQRRVWRLVRLPDGRWQGRADDVVGVALGAAAGNAFHWRYVLDLPVGARRYQVGFDDWMFLVDGDTLVNRARMSKFGVTLGEVTLLFRRRA